jgi:plasmid stability protein
MEDEARDILRTALAQESAETRNLADAIRELVEPLGGVELELPPRGPMQEPPNFK